MTPQVTDVVMPLMSGKKLAERLLQQHATVKILFISGYTDGAFSNVNALKQAEAFLPMPFLPEDLLLAARELLDRPG